MREEARAPPNVLTITELQETSVPPLSESHLIARIHADARSQLPFPHTSAEEPLYTYTLYTILYTYSPYIGY